MDLGRGSRLVYSWALVDKMVSRNTKEIMKRRESRTVLIDTSQPLLGVSFNQSFPSPVIILFGSECVLWCAS